jgi:hypothetical protein
MYWFHSKNFENFFFAQNMFFTYKKSLNVKKAIKNFRPSRAATEDNFFYTPTA